jgi:hypothetical protein
MMEEAEEMLLKELIAVIAEIDRLLGTVARDAAWKERHGTDYARFAFLSAKLSGMRAAIDELRRREEQQ